MLPISKTRIFIVLFVTIVAFAATIPTARYYAALSHQPPQKGARPAMTGPPPAADQQEAYAKWTQENPDAAKWYKENADFIKWEQRTDDLRKRPFVIPLGLDLIGGVDVTLRLDEEQQIKNEVTGFMDSIKDDLDKAKVSATYSLAVNGQSFTLKVAPADAQVAYNIVKKYEYRIDQVPTQDQLTAGVPITLKNDRLRQDIAKALEGARKGITDRVDALGVTQPRISMQGSDRIRVQVPGEKDPDRLINTVIQPAQLELRLVDQRMNEVIGQDGKVRPGAKIPPGSEIKLGKEGKFNAQTQKFEYKDTSYLLFRKAELTGKDLRSASANFNPNVIDNPYQVSLEFKDEGAAKFAQVTTQNTGKQMAILLDGVVRSAPRINEPIRDGRAQITGNFSNEEANDLSQILKAGSLPAPLKIETKRTVGASVGTESIHAGVKALAYGALIIAVLMTVYYSTAGFISVLALILNVMIVLAIMAFSKATLTLSGIGGILLTIGMAVDANILIYERIREELAAGRPLKQAIGLGVHRAFAVILDAHLTTLFSALVLLQFTEGSVFGFALTMTFGLLSNLFTGLTVTYTLCMLWFHYRKGLSLGRLAIFHKPNVDFIGLRWFSISLSNIVLFGALILVLFTHSFRYGVDFKGGERLEAQFKTKVSEGDIRKALNNAGFADPNVQPATDTPNYFIIDVPLKNQDAQGTESAMVQALDQSFPGKYEVKLKSSFGAQSSQEFTQLAFLVTILASGAILLYLWFRFELVFGVAAVVALLHDLIIVFLLACLWKVQVNLEMVAALMVLMGFSVNDTIVIFDRIRENTRIMTGKNFGEICNLAMNQSLSRTVLTSSTVFLAVLMLYFFGGEGLRSFSKVYLLGTICGTYSSDFIAAPIVYMWDKFKGHRLQQALQLKKAKREVAKPIRSGAAATRPATEKTK